MTSRVYHASNQPSPLRGDHHFTSNVQRASYGEIRYVFFWLIRRYTSFDSMKEYYVQPYKGLHIKVNFLEIFYPQSFVQVALISRKLFFICDLLFIFFIYLFQLAANQFPFFCFSAHEEEGQESQVSEEAVETRPLKDRRTNFRSTRSKSESSAHYLSWENVSFLGGELRKTISKGFQWIAYPSVGKIMEKTWLICSDV